MNKLLQIIDKYPPELKLLLVCCGSKRWKSEDLIIEVDWDLFLQMLAKHRVTPCIYKYIKINPEFFPKRIEERICESQKQIAFKSLKLHSQIIKLGRILDERGIGWFTMKGAALAEILTYDVAGRDYRDIDIFIEAKSFEKVHKIMLELGFEYLHKIITKSLIEVNHNAEYRFSSKEGYTKVEVHWRLFANRFLMEENINAYFKEYITIEKKGMKIPNNNIHYLYIINHGAIHRFSELQWLMDVKKFALQNSEYETIRKNSRIVSLSNNLLKFLFWESQKQIKGIDKFLLKTCIKAIGRNNINMIDKINKTFYLFSLSSNIKYKVEVIKLRVKRIFSNPALKMEKIK